MPRYHFDLVDSKTVADHGGRELPDNATAERVAKQLAVSLREAQPALGKCNFAILVTNQDGERVCRVLLDPLN